MGKREEILIANDACLSKQELMGHANSTLEESRQQRVDAHLQNCELCAMATKGFSVSPNLAMLGVLDNDLHELVDAKYPSGGGFNLQQALNVVFGVVIVAGAVYFFSNLGQNTTESMPLISDLVEADEIVEQAPFEVSVPGLPVPDPDEEATITIRKKEVEASPIQSEPAVEERRQIVVANFMPLLSMDLNAIQPTDGEREPRARITTNTKYVLDMKTYDYEKFYKREHEETWYNPNMGLPAEYSHSTDVITYNNGPDYRTIWRTYEEILESALRDYKGGRYTKSLVSLNLLLEDFPSDINGLFYKGLCLYKIKKYNKCISYMSSVSADVNPTFDQEAEWFVALAHLKLGERAEAIERLNSIVEYDGFYKQKALAELKVIE